MGLDFGAPKPQALRHVWLSVGSLGQALRLQYARTSLWGSWVPALRSKPRRGWTMGAELVKNIEVSGGGGSSDCSSQLHGPGVC